MTTSLGDRLAGGIWGHLVGDAVGVPYEFGPPVPADQVRFGARGMHGQPPGTWSDDGALMLALLESLLHSGFDTTDQARRALAWHQAGSYTPDGDGAFDIGNATRAALSNIERGVPAEEAGRKDERACGNGSLMRILPLALVERDLPIGQLVDHAHRASRVTHGHPRTQVACAVYVLIARRLLEGSANRVNALADARSQLRQLYESSAGFDDHWGALDHLEGWTGRTGEGVVWDSFWSAWDAFAGAESYEETIRRAVAYGFDTDTTACIAGGLAGIYWGIDGIPPEWLDGMRGKAIVWPLVAKLLGSAGYKTDEIRVNWVDLKAAPGLSDGHGRLGMTFLPGNRYPGLAGNHWRDVEADAVALRERRGVDTFGLLVEDRELEAAHVRNIGSVMQRHGIELLRHPITDARVPTDLSAFRQTLATVEQRLQAGKNVAIACMGGLGRTGTTVACLLRNGGLDAKAAINLTRATRPGAIENSAQEEFVRRWQ